jgi:hypothetical protein
MTNIRDRFSKNAQISNFVKIRPVRDVMFHMADGQTDARKIIVAFRNFANAPNQQGECFYRLSCHQLFLST